MRRWRNVAGSLCWRRTPLSQTLRARGRERAREGHLRAMNEKQLSGEPGKVGGAAAIDRLIGLAQRVIDERRKALELEFGWTYLRATAHARPDARQLVVEGEVILARITGQLQQDLLAALPSGWTLSTLNLRLVAGGSWRYLSQGVTRLQRCLPSGGHPVTLTTELLPEDGPVCSASRSTMQPFSSAPWMAPSGGPAARSAPSPPGPAAARYSSICHG